MLKCHYKNATSKIYGSSSEQITQYLYKYKKGLMGDRKRSLRDLFINCNVLDPPLTAHSEKTLLKALMR